MSDLVKLWVSDKKRGRLRKAPNAYTDAEDARQMAWRVTLSYDKFPDRAIDVWFQDDAEAAGFELAGLHPLTQVLAELAPFNAKFTPTGAPVKDARTGKKNLYTDRPTNDDSWHSLLWCEQYNRWTDLWYGAEAAGQAQASQWVPGETYSLYDAFRLFQILVLFYPAHDYVAEISLKGFIDQYGYHRPGYYPAGFYPAGFELGGNIALATVTQNLGQKGYISFATAVALGLKYGISFTTWQLVFATGAM